MENYFVSYTYKLTGIQRFEDGIFNLPGKIKDKKDIDNLRKSIIESQNGQIYDIAIISFQNLSDQ